MSNTDKKYYYAHAGGSPEGPFSENELRMLLSQGKINGTTNVIQKGQQQWSLIKNVLKNHEIMGGGRTSPPVPSPILESVRSSQRSNLLPQTSSPNDMDDYVGITQEGKRFSSSFLEKDFMPTLMDAYGIAIKNAFSVVLSIVFWFLTIWIPYINIGTTIALWTMPLALSRNKPISPTFIFDKRYRQFFGEFLLAMGLLCAGVLAGLLFFGIPAIIIFIAWSLAPMILLDKGVNAAEALTLSNKYTYGNKFLIFVLYLCLYLSLGIILGVIGLILGAVSESLVFISIVLAVVLVPSTTIGLEAAIYKRLVFQRKETV